MEEALNDPEGHALVNAILDRKQYRNMRERFLQQIIWGDVRTDGHGNVIPRDKPWYWETAEKVLDAYREDKPAKLTYTRKINAPAVLGVDFGGPEITAVWVDEPLRLVPRGHGKTARMNAKFAKLLTGEKPTPAPTAPPVSAVRWKCARPSWDISPISLDSIEDNRKLINKWAPLFRTEGHLLGIRGDDGSNNR